MPNKSVSWSGAQGSGQSCFILVCTPVRAQNTDDTKRLIRAANTSHSAQWIREKSKDLHVTAHEKSVMNLELNDLTPTFKPKYTARNRRQAGDRSSNFTLTLTHHHFLLLLFKDWTEVSSIIHWVFANHDPTLVDTGICFDILRPV
jgi:hypothetical protein